MKTLFVILGVPCLMILASLAEASSITGVDAQKRFLLMYNAATAAEMSDEPGSVLITKYGVICRFVLNANQSFSREIAAAANPSQFSCVKDSGSPTIRPRKPKN